MQQSDGSNYEAASVPPVGVVGNANNNITSCISTSTPTAPVAEQKHTDAPRRLVVIKAPRDKPAPLMHLQQESGDGIATPQQPTSTKAVRFSEASPSHLPPVVVVQRTMSTDTTGGYQSDARNSDGATLRSHSVRFSITTPARGNIEGCTQVESDFEDVEPDDELATARDGRKPGEENSELLPAPLLELHPYSVVTRTGGVRIHWHTQVLALLQRTSRQFWRNKVGFICEILSPILFVVLLIILDKAFGVEKVSRREYGTMTEFSYQMNSKDYLTYTCYRYRDHPIDGLYHCNELHAEVKCDGDDVGLPVVGLCFLASLENAATVAQQYLESLTGTMIALPVMDSVIVHQWMAKKAGFAKTTGKLSSLAALTSVGLSMSSSTRYDSIAYSGKLYFAPASKVPASLIDYFNSVSPMFKYVYGGTFETVEAANAYMKDVDADTTSVNSTWGVVVIEDIEDGFDVQIRLHSKALPNLKQPVDVMYRGGYNYDGSDMYLASGFSTLQKVLYDYYYTTALSSGKINPPGSSYSVDTIYQLIASYPTIATQRSYLFSLVSSLAAFIVVLAFLYPFAQITKRVVLEKELRIREAMCIMGLKRLALWINFFTVAFLELLLISIIFTVILCAVVVTRSNPFVIFLIILLYCLSLIPLAGLVSTFFSKARLAALLSPLIYFVLAMPIFAMGSASRGVTLGVSILSPTAIAAFLTDAFSTEAGSGFTPDDLNSPLYTSRPYLLMVLLGCDFVIYLLLMLYFDAVLPQEWGVRRHPLFFILDPYDAWQKRLRGVKAEAGSSGAEIHEDGPQRGSCNSSGNKLKRGSSSSQASSRLITPPASGLPLDEDYTLPSSSATCLPNAATDPTIKWDPITGAEKAISVSINHLHKRFKRDGKTFSAVNNISWDLYRGDIAVLLGPNGSGKSTTINIITGMLTADEGDCSIEGYSTSRHLSSARHEIGFCPQHNILWPDLTCREHLEFFGKIKGLCGAELENSVIDMLRAVDLEEKIDFVPPMLSGGQRRKLSVAIAFVGRGRVVLLDEPTAGMDPAARRHTWSLLRAMTKHHTILLTTHFMDEADLLGDNVAIVSSGTVQCIGSTSFLRRFAGVGYTLRFDLRAFHAQPSETEWNQELQKVWRSIDTLVQTHLPGAALTLQTDAEVEYELQQKMEQSIPSFLKVLESRQNHQLHIRSYSLTAPTLDDVFVRVVENPISRLSLPHTDQQMTTIVKTSTPEHDRRQNEKSTEIEPETSLAVPMSTRSYQPLQRRASRASLRFLQGEQIQTFHGMMELQQSTTDGSENSDDTELSFCASHSYNNEEFFHSVPCFESICTPSRKPASELQPRTSLGGPSILRKAGESSTAFGPVTPTLVPPFSSPVIASASRSVRFGGTEFPLENHFPEVSTVENGNSTGRRESVGTSLAVSTHLSAKVEAMKFKNIMDHHLDFVWETKQVTAKWKWVLLQFWAMMYKRFFCSLRDRRMQFFQIVCPVFCILLAVLLQLVVNDNQGTLYFSPALYRQETETSISGCTDYFGSLTDASSWGHELSETTFTDRNFVSMSDMVAYELDTWFVHEKPRYNSLQCRDQFISFIMSLWFASAVNGRAITVLTFNTSSLHSLPIGLHETYSLAYFRGLSSSEAARNTTFSMSVQSLPKSSASTSSDNAIAGILIGIILLIPFTFLPANPVSWVVKENESQSRHLQRVSGLNYLIYWFGNFCFDFAAYAVTMILILCIFAIFQRSEYVGVEAIGATIVAFTLYGLCCCFGSYALSFLFTEHTTAQMVVLGCSFFTGFFCVMLVFVLSLSQDTLSASKTMRWVFRVLPTYAIGEVILNLSLLKQNQQSDATLTPWSFSVTLWPDIYMAAEVPVFVLITLLWDHPSRRAVLMAVKASFQRCGCCCPPRHKSSRKSSKKKTIHGVPATITPQPLPARMTVDKEGPVVNSTPPAVHRMNGASQVRFVDPSSTFLGPMEESLSSYAWRGPNNASTPRHPNGTLAQFSAVRGPNASLTSPSAADANGNKVTFARDALNLPAYGDMRRVSQASATSISSSAALPSWMASSNLNVSIVPAEPLMYPAPRWTRGDELRRIEEDSDVEEERKAVHKDERTFQQIRKRKSKVKGITDNGNTNASPGMYNDNECIDVVRVVDLRKEYDHPHKIAVSSLAFTVTRGEVFGFLGTNGAGKSTVMSILTQEQLPTSGRAYICGHDVVRNSAQASQRLGYCPQFDACFDLLTVEEHLKMYAMVRGIPSSRIARLTDCLLHICNLELYRRTLSRGLSGGNRRKLSVAISLIGAPQVVCLDEPTAGLDPLARRLLWRSLDRVSQKCSIILTTHHLEEVETLADSVGIMVDGGFRCFGDLPHLKHKYARSAYELTLRVSKKAASQQQQKSVRVAPSEAEANHERRNSTYAGLDLIDITDKLFQFMNERFPSALLIDNFNNERYIYTVPATRDVADVMSRLQRNQSRRQSTFGASSSFGGRNSRSSFRRRSSSGGSAPILRLSEIFETLRAYQDQLGITDFSVSQVSLEQVFLQVCSSEEARRRNQALSRRKHSASTIGSETPWMNQSRTLSVRGSQLLMARRASQQMGGRQGMSGVISHCTSPRQHRMTFAQYRRERALHHLIENKRLAAMGKRKPSEPDHETEVSFEQN